jgi:hypothetical protein
MENNRQSDTKPALLGVACGLGAALFWALGLVARIAVI